MNAKYAMNHNTSYKTSSDISQDMLILNGQLNSGMERGDSSHYQNHHKNEKNKSQYRDPNHFKQYEPAPNVAYSRAAFNRFGNIMENLQPVNDEMRKKPFTVPSVRVQIASQSPMEVSNISNAKTKQSQVSYID